MSILLLLIFLIGVGLFFPYLFFLFFPGFILLFLKNLEDDFLLKINLVFGFSFAYWIITFWFLYFPIFKFLIWGSMISTIIMSLILAFKNKRKITRIDYFLLSIFLIFGIVRFFPMLRNEAPPGADITMHTYNTLLISFWQKIPENYQPIFDMKGFGAQAQGFSILSAIFSFVANSPAYRATFFISCFTYFLVLGGFYVFLRAFVIPEVALLTALIFAFFSPNPQNFYFWGGTPSILAFFFSLLSFYFFIQEIRNRGVSFLNIILFAIFISAGFLTHFIPLSIFLIILLVISFYELIFSQKERKKFLIKIALSGFFISIFSLSYFVIFKQVVTSEREWQIIFDWNDTFLWRKHFATNFILQKFSFLGSFVNIFLPFIKMILTIGFPIIILGIIGMIKIKREIPKKIIFISFFTILIFLYLNLFVKMKFAQIFYPDRVSLYSHLPIGILIGKLIEQVFHQRSRKILLYFIVYIIIGIAIFKFVFKDKPLFSYQEEKSIYREEKSILSMIGNEFLGIYFYRYLWSQDNYLLSKGDLEAFEWIKNNCEKGIILINYGDTGMWIPAILGRPVYGAHIVFNLLDEYQFFIEKSKLEDFKYLYIGSKNISQNIFFSEENLPKEVVKKIYEKDKVVVYQVIDPLWVGKLIYKTSD